MRRFIIALGALVAMADVGQLATPARAEYAFCRTGGGGDGGYGMRCDFQTYEQCLATTSGLGGGCMANPFPDRYSNANASYPNANMNYRGRTRRAY
jgi:Protein of unknown function (DUF3551)